jgi:nucleoside-diphosphate-sugar epimerase
VTPRHRPKILVTGAGGYIGAPTTRALVSDGCDVHVLGRADPTIPGTTFHRADLLQTIDVTAVIEEIGAETLLHAAWSVTPGKFWTDPANLDWTAASSRLFHAFAKSGGKRIVGVGSCAEYDWSTSPLTEFSSAICPATLYGKAKADVWSLLEALGRQQDLSVAWGRLFFLYGPGEPEGKLVADAVNALITKRRFLTTPGLQKRDFIYVEDAAEALARLTLSSTVGPVNIASGQAISVRDLLEHIEAATQTNGLIDFDARALAKGEPSELVADVSRLRDEVGFISRFTLMDGIARTVAWWREKAAMGTCV